MSYSFLCLKQEHNRNFDEIYCTAGIYRLNLKFNLLFGFFYCPDPLSMSVMTVIYSNNSDYRCEF